MAFRGKNTRKNPDDKQTMLVSVLEILRKNKGYLRQKSALACKVYQPKVTQVNVKISTKEIILLNYKERHKKISFHRSLN
jgi:hypothetical protein